uniref:Major facilitator superfamily (MFS) profile domain-containing protein n=1 Tax=Glossina brevipalpis TaxID=37001 RepID=A0A1A9W3V6_9MUSC
MSFLALSHTESKRIAKRNEKYDQVQPGFCNEVEKPKTEVPVDPIIVHLGDLGRYQLFYCLIIFVAKFPSAWVTLAHLFVAGKAEYYCKDPSDADPCSKDCKTPDFNRSIFSETIEMTFDLTCGRFWLSSLTQFAVMGGIMVGAIIFGILSDKFGRRIIFNIECVLQLICGTTASFSVNYPMYITLRFLHAANTGGQMTTSFVIIMEIIGPRYREAMTILYQIPFFSGYALLPFISYFLRDWHYFYLAISSISFFYLIYICLIFESPRWLFTTGRLEKAISIVEKVAKRNGRSAKDIDEIRPKMEAAYQQLLSSAPKKKGTLVDLFRTPNLRLNTIVMVYQWLNACMVLYGSAQYISQLGGNIFINVCISGISGIPGCVACICMTKYFGRRLTLILSNLVSAVGFLLIACITTVNHIVVVTFAIIGLFGATVTFPNLYLYAGEIFPTVVRTTGVGLCSCIGRVGSMIAPFVTSDLAAYSPIIPPLVYGIIASLGFILTFLLPETKGRQIAETLEDGEAIGKIQKKPKMES